MVHYEKSGKKYDEELKNGDQDIFDLLFEKALIENNLAAKT